MIKKIIFGLMISVVAFSSCEKDIDTNAKIVKNLDYDIKAAPKESYTAAQSIVLEADLTDNDGLLFVDATIYTDAFDYRKDDYLEPADNFTTSFLKINSDVTSSETHKTPYKSYTLKSTLPLSGLVAGDYIYELMIRKRVNGVNRDRFKYYKFKIN